MSLETGHPWSRRRPRRRRRHSNKRVGRGAAGVCGRSGRRAARSAVRARARGRVGADRHMAPRAGNSAVGVVAQSPSEVHGFFHYRKGVVLSYYEYTTRMLRRASSIACWIGVRSATSASPRTPCAITHRGHGWRTRTRRIPRASMPTPASVGRPAPCRQAPPRRCRPSSPGHTRGRSASCASSAAA